MNKQQTTRLALICAGLALVLALCLAPGLMGDSEKQALERYYSAMYTQDGGGIDAVVGCLAPDLQSDYYDTVTIGGTSFQQVNVWRMEAIELVGDQVKLKIKVLSTGEDSSATLAQLRQQYAGAEQAHTVAFQLDLTGDSGSETFVGVLPMIRIGGRWYLLSANADLRRVVDDQ